MSNARSVQTRSSSDFKIVMPTNSKDLQIRLPA